MRSMWKSRLALTLALIITLGLCGPARASGLEAACEPASATVGAQVVFTLRLTNTTGYTMQNLSYSADYSGFSFNGPGAVGPEEIGVYTSTVAMTQAMLDVPITFTLHWEYYDQTGMSQGAESATATLTVPTDLAMGGVVGGALVTAERTADVTQASRGETINIVYTVQNNSASELKKLSIKDAELSSKELVKDVTVAPGELYTFPYAYTMGSATVKSAPVISYTVEGEAQTVTVSEVTLGMINTRLTVDVKAGAPQSEGVTFTLYLTNNGNQKISKIKIKDEQGESVNADAFALSVGESKTFTYMVPNENERNVVFYLTGTDAQGEAYEDKTKTYTVRRYVDPSLVGLDFSASVLETLNQSGSIKVRFVVNNTGSLPLQNLVLTESELGEIRRQETVPLGDTVLEETVYVGAPRDMVFTLNVQDEAGNDYTYNANITAAYIGVAQAQTASGTNAIDDIEDLGSQIGNSVNNALTVALVILAVLCVLSAVAFVTLGVLEKKQRAEAARRRAYRERQQRAAQETTQAARPAPYPNGYEGYDPYGGTQNTIVRPTRPRE